MIKFRWPRNSQKPNDRTVDGSDLLSTLQEVYAPLQVPHRGDPALLSEAQVDDNERYYVSNLQQREDAIKALLRRHGVHWPKDLAGVDHTALVSDTRTWAKTHWPALRKPIETDNIRKLWLEGERDGDCIGLSIVTDLAILLGQYVVANRSTLRWGMDKDLVNKADGMVSANRWVLLGDWLPDRTTKVVIDIEHVVLTLFANPEDSSERLFNTWNTVINDCLSGGYEGAALS